MSLDRFEIGKQMQKYADAITAFALVQAVGLCLLIGESERLAFLVAAEWFIASPIILVSYIAYWLVVRGCQRAEKACSEAGITQDELLTIAATIAKARLRLILIVGIGLVIFVYGAHHAQVPPCPGK